MGVQNFGPATVKDLSVKAQARPRNNKVASQEGHTACKTSTICKGFYTDLQGNQAPTVVAMERQYSYRKPRYISVL